MPSWNDGSSSSQSLLGDLTDQDYAPDTTEDLTFVGLAVGCGVVCPVHRLDHVRCVAFEGMNTGRRFYMCQVENKVTNCSFVSWYDDDWPEPLQNALARLWAMYEESNRIRIDERLQNAKLVQGLVEEKNKVQKNYSSLLNDVKKFMNDAEKAVMVKNLATIKEDSEQKEDELTEMKKEMSKLMEEVAMMKQLQKSQAEVMKGKQKTCDEERDALKEEKKKLEYMLFDLLKARDSEREDNHASMDKVKRIKAICDE